MTGMSTATQLQGRDRAAHYYGSARPEVAALVPIAARRVLDIGCGAGALGRLLQTRGHTVAGVELIPAVAAEARLHLAEVVCADVEADELPWPAAAFDAIICADVLEHLTDPWRVLRQLAPLLTPGGQLIASVPNVQNLRIIRDLLRGRWRYRERGILDHGHLRFFTWESLVELFAAADLAVIAKHANYRRTPLRRCLCALSAGQAEPFFARSYLAVGVRRPT